MRSVFLKKKKGYEITKTRNMNAISSDLFSIGLVGLSAVAWLLGVMNDNGVIAASGLTLVALNTYLQLGRKES